LRVAVVVVILVADRPEGTEHVGVTVAVVKLETALAAEEEVPQTVETLKL
jgi:hypothetical protein